jgi:hypothetical protein
MFKYKPVKSIHKPLAEETMRKWASALSRGITETERKIDETIIYTRIKEYQKENK